MSTLAWMCVIFGGLVSIAIISVLVYDPYAVAKGIPTVSQITLTIAELCGWFAYLLAVLIAAPVRALLGHLLWASNGQGRPAAILAAVVSLFLSFILGHRFLGQ